MAKDSLTRRARSERMALVRSTGNRSTERRLRALLVSKSIQGWRLHSADLPGKPDFIFDDLKIVIFVDGCFWHGCHHCNRNTPTASRDYWSQKIVTNRARDVRVTAKLRRQGWRVFRLWEHELKRRPYQKGRISRLLGILMRLPEK